LEGRDSPLPFISVLLEGSLKAGLTPDFELLVAPILHEDIVPHLLHEIVDRLTLLALLVPAAPALHALSVHNNHVCWEFLALLHDDHVANLQVLPQVECKSPLPSR